MWTKIKKWAAGLIAAALIAAGAYFTTYAEANHVSAYTSKAVENPLPVELWQPYMTGEQNGKVIEGFATNDALVVSSKAECLFMVNMKSVAWLRQLEFNGVLDPKITCRIIPAPEDK